MYKFKNLTEIFTKLEEGFCQDLSYKAEMLHSELFTEIIKDFIKFHKVTIVEFNLVAKDFKALDLVYSDYI